jgi:hypothetical protein
MDTPALPGTPRPPRSRWRLRALAAATSLLAVIVPLAPGPVPAANAQTVCTFQLGFATLRTVVGPPPPATV